MMRLSYVGRMRLCSTLCGLLCVAGCAAVSPTTAVQLGEQVWVDYICRLSDGRVAATTIPEDAERDMKRQGTLLLDLDEHRPALWVAAKASVESRGKVIKAKLVPLQEEIKNRLQPELAGMSKSRSNALRISSNYIERLSDGSRYLNLARRRTYPKVYSVPHGQILQSLGRLPEVGSRFDYDLFFDTVVKAVETDSVLFNLSPRGGAEVFQTPLGKASIGERGSNYEITYHVAEGQIVRDGPYIGRVVRADEARFTVDFGHPFAGEDLNCELTVIKDIESMER